MAVVLVNSLSAGSTNLNGFTSGTVDMSTGGPATLLVLQIADGAGASTFTDSQSNTYTLAAQNNLTDGNRLYYCSSPSVSTTMSWTITSTSAPSFTVMGFAGVAATPLDQTNANGNASGTQQPGSITPSGNGYLVVTGAGWNTANGSVPAVDSSFSTPAFIDGLSGAHLGSGLAYLIQGAAAAVNPTWSGTNSILFIGTTIASFIPAPAAPTGTPGPTIRARAFRVGHPGPRFMPVVTVGDRSLAAGFTAIGVTTGLALAANPGAVAVTLPGTTAGIVLAGSVGTVAVTLPGVTAAVVLAAPAGSVNIGSNVNITGVTTAIVLAAPAGSVSATLPGVTARITLLANPGAVSVGLPGATPNIALLANPGTVAVTLPGATPNIQFNAPAGSVNIGSNVNITGVTATVVLAAPAGGITTGATFAGATTGITLVGQIGAVSVTLPGATTALVLHATAGLLSTGATGTTPTVSIVAHAGAVSVALLGVTPGIVFQAYPPLPPFSVGALSSVETATATLTPAASAVAASLSATETKPGGPS